MEKMNSPERENLFRGEGASIFGKLSPAVTQITVVPKSLANGKLRKAWTYE